MTALTLSGWASLEVLQTLLVFVRISAAMMLLPGFGEPSIPVRIRILAGLAVAAVVAPSVEDMPRTIPATADVMYDVMAEAVNGLLLGSLCRTLISAILTAGQFISQAIGMTNVFSAGVSMDQSPTIGAVIYAGCVAIMFASRGHHLILRGLLDSYHVLPAARFPNPGASAKALVTAGVQALRLAGQIALPFLVLALLFNTSLAVINRALPAIPVFMLANPILVVFGLYLLAATAPGILDPSLASWSDVTAFLR